PGVGTGPGPWCDAGTATRPTVPPARSRIAPVYSDDRLLQGGGRRGVDCDDAAHWLQLDANAHGHLSARDNRAIVLRLSVPENQPAATIQRRTAPCRHPGSRRAADDSIASKLTDALGARAAHALDVHNGLGGRAADVGRGGSL